MWISVSPTSSTEWMILNLAPIQYTALNLSHLMQECYILNCFTEWPLEWIDGGACKSSSRHGHDFLDGERGAGERSRLYDPVHGNRDRYLSCEKDWNHFSDSISRLFHRLYNSIRKEVISLDSNCCVIYRAFRYGFMAVGGRRGNSGGRSGYFPFRVALTIRLQHAGKCIF